MTPTRITHNWSYLGFPVCVLENEVIFGSVNANRRHYEAAVRALAAAERSWLERLVTRRVPLTRWREAFESRPDDVKTVLQFYGA